MAAGSVGPVPLPLHSHLDGMLLVSRASPLPSTASLSVSARVPILKAIGAAEGSGLARETSMLHAWPHGSADSNSD